MQRARKVVAMQRLKPTSDFMIITKYSDVSESLILPDKAKGDLFRVLDIGPGYMSSQGKRIKPDVRCNDIVAVMGNIVTIPFQGERYDIARSGDVIAYYRQGKFTGSEIDIPDKI